MHSKRLPNGVRVPLPLGGSGHAVGGKDEGRDAVPDPGSLISSVCNFLMSRGVIPGRPEIGGLIFHFLLKARGDVPSACPDAANGSSDEGFRNWVTSSGTKEYALKGLLKFEDNKAVTDHVRELFERLRSSSGEDARTSAASHEGCEEGFAGRKMDLRSKGHKRLRVSRTHGKGAFKSVQRHRQDFEYLFPQR